MTITHLLLDIEGTTCPITFVAEVLFPYAQEQLQTYIHTNSTDNTVRLLIRDAWDEWRIDTNPTSQELLEQSIEQAEDHDHSAIHNYLQHLIAIDRKSTALKDLQGRIWKQGYTSGDIQSELFPDALPAFRSWIGAGYTLAVYSSGSVSAQQLLYQYTPEGDVRTLFNGWYDTRTGPKKESRSYQAIAKDLNVLPQSIAFISDNKAECDAAEGAGLHTIFSLRDGNPDRSPGHHPVIDSLDQVLAQVEHTHSNP